MKYNPTVHAVERIRQYFGVMEEHAKQFANELMRAAKYVTTQADGKLVYKHAGKDVMLVVNAETRTVITVLPPAGEGERNKAITSISVTNNAIIAAAHATIQRELAKARRSYTREYRKLTEEIAVIGLEIAHLSLNKARARSPITQRQISEKVAEIHAEQTRLADQRKRLEAEYQAAKTEAQAFISNE